MASHGALACFARSYLRRQAIHFIYLHLSRMLADPQSERQTHYFRWWAALGLITVLLLVFITPPFQVPDEAQHFFRAYEISEGNLIAEVRGQTAGARLPSSLQELSHHFLGSRKLHTNRPVTPTPLSDTLAQLARPLDAGRREFVVFTGAAAYGPLAYIPQALGIKLAVLADASVLTMFYLSRIVNGMCALALLAYAVWLMPRGRELIAFAALLPMGLYLYASASPDAMVISFAFMYTALILNRMTTDTWSHRDTVLAVVSAATLCMIKPVYLPLLLLGFVQLLYTRRRLFTVITQGGILLATCAVTLLWGICAASAIIPVPEGINVSGQIDQVLREPFQYMLTIARSLLWRGFYYKQLIGTLGWLTFELPVIAYWLPAVAAVLALGSEKLKFSRQAVIFLAISLSIIAACTLLIFTALYVSWTPVGNVIVEGIQGRYFLPVLPLGLVAGLLAFGRRIWWSRTVVQVGMLGLGALEAGILVHTVATTYSVFGS